MAPAREVHEPAPVLKKAEKTGRVETISPSVTELIDEENFPKDKDKFIARMLEYGVDAKVYKDMRLEQVLKQATNLRVLATSNEVTILGIQIPKPELATSSTQGISIVLGENYPPVFNSLLHSSFFNPKTSVEKIRALYNSFQDGVIYSRLKPVKGKTEEYERQLRIFKNDGQVVESQDFPDVNAKYMTLPSGDLVFKAYQDKNYEEEKLLRFDGAKFLELFSQRYNYSFYCPCGPELGVFKLITGLGKLYTEQDVQLFLIDKDNKLQKITLPRKMLLHKESLLEHPPLGIFHFVIQDEALTKYNLYPGCLIIDADKRIGISSDLDGKRIAEASRVSFSEDRNTLHYQHEDKAYSLTYVAPQEKQDYGHWVRLDAGITESEPMTKDDIKLLILRRVSTNPVFIKALDIPKDKITHPTILIDGVSEFLSENRRLSEEAKVALNQAKDGVIEELEQTLRRFLKIPGEWQTEYQQRLEHLKELRKEEVPESLVPREVGFITADEAEENTAESSVRKIVLRGRDGEKVNLWYKRPVEGGRLSKEFMGERSLQRGLSAKEASLLAKRKQEEYLNYQACFGKEHVAQTYYTVGTDISYHHPQVHIYQEDVGETMPHALGQYKAIPLEKPDYRQVRKEKLEAMKVKGFNQLDPNDLAESTIAENLRKHQEALQRFYPSYVEALLMGFVPDLQYYDEKDEYTDVGLMFNDNLGIGTDSDGVERVKVFDFGEPRFDVLTLASRQRLRALIEEHKENGQLPICNTIRRNIDSETGKPIGKPWPGIRRLADWYEEALRKEISESLEEKQPVGIYMVKSEKKEEILEEIIRDIIRNVGCVHQDTPKNRYYKDLEAFRRLCNASKYETQVIVDYKS